MQSEPFEKNYSNPAPVIAVQHLTKVYGATPVLHGLNFAVRRGEVFALLGPNGAGKTTTVEILEGFGRRTAGSVAVLGTDPAAASAAWRDRIGMVLQESAPEPGLSVAECLRLYAGYYQTPRGIEETLELVGLTGQGSTLAGHLSGGQRRRLDVALALIGNPELIFLDEPTTGFDPAARRDAWQMVAGLRELGTTVFLTTHYMDEAERLADQIAVLVAGRIVATGTPDTLGGRQLRPSLIRFTMSDGSPAHPLPAEFGGTRTGLQAGVVEMETSHPLDQVATLASWARRSGAAVTDLDVRRPTLEDIYLDLTTGEAS